jgi:hypothetical protein
MLIVYTLANGPGWHPVTHMVRLAAELFEAELMILPEAPGPGLAAKLAALVPRLRRGESCLLVCAGPPQIQSMLLVEEWRRRFGRIVAWVIDSFWTDWIPWTARLTRHVDRYFVTNEEEMDEWKRRTGTPTGWLPWGTDALRLGSGGAARPYDLLRFGRQPASWENDEETRRVCLERGLEFGGRPPTFDDATDNERALMEALGLAKFSLSFSNRVSPSVQTHPTREYVTGRWVDALAAGVTVAGVAPRCSATRTLFWPGALLEIGSTDREEGIAVVAAASRAWSPARAKLNHQRSLERLDWRWSFRQLAEALGEPALPLQFDLERLRETIRQGSPAGETTGTRPG